MYTSCDDNDSSDHPDFHSKQWQATRHLPRSLDEAVSDSPRTRLFQQTPDSAQATMQATSTSALEPAASDQSLAQSPVKAEMKNVQ